MLNLMDQPRLIIIINAVVIDDLSNPFLFFLLFIFYTWKYQNFFPSAACIFRTVRISQGRKFSGEQRTKQEVHLYL